MLTATWLAQLGVRWPAEQEVVSSNLGQSKTQGLKITEGNVQPLT